MLWPALSGSIQAIRISIQVSELSVDPHHTHEDMLMPIRLCLQDTDYGTIHRVGVCHESSACVSEPVPNAFLHANL